ncbi:MAG: carbohydrate ABC transporter permease [Clostridiaceae bacterium]|nr:carbohydrate ABC transporter permease [Clostridiaceae bacterium]
MERKTLIRSRRKKWRVDRITWFDYFNVILLALLSLTFILPFLTVAGSSLLGYEESVRRGTIRVIFPESPDFACYRILLGRNSAVYRGYFITILRVIVGTTLNLLFTGTMSYGLSKRSLPGKNTLTTIVFFTMLFSGGLIPNYLLYQLLGITNTFWVMILPLLINPWWMFIMRNFFREIPDSIEESALIDGASPFRIFFVIIIPLSAASFATIGMFYAVMHWNAWFDAAVFITNTKLYPVQVLMRNVVLSATSTDLNNEVLSGFYNKPPTNALKSAMIVVSTLPILAIYPFIQKYFVKGMVVGSIKG